jgi:hypothetical protein
VRNPYGAVGDALEHERAHLSISAIDGARSALPMTALRTVLWPIRVAKLTATVVFLI